MRYNASTQFLTEILYIPQSNKWQIMQLHKDMNDFLQYQKNTKDCTKSDYKIHLLKCLKSLSKELTAL
jgi:hypothetical protein